VRQLGTATMGWTGYAVTDHISGATHLAGKGTSNFCTAGSARQRCQRDATNVHADSGWIVPIVTHTGVALQLLCNRDKSRLMWLISAIRLAFAECGRQCVTGLRRPSIRQLDVMNATGIESQIEAFLGRYTPSVETQLREARARLRAMFPRGFELVFDTYNALVFGISPTERRSDSFLSVVGYPKWVTLFFLNGTDLHDPHGLLEGQGKQVRSIRLKHPADINTPEVEALIAQAVARHEVVLRVAPILTTVIKSVTVKQRPRRPRS
jgi:hypothetical protein